jgi:hypothetical protein
MVKFEIYVFELFVEQNVTQMKDKLLREIICLIK